jgi:hypothetical protein
MLTGRVSRECASAANGLAGFACILPRMLKVGDARQGLAGFFFGGLLLMTEMRM